MHLLTVTMVIITAAMMDIATVTLMVMPALHLGQAHGMTIVQHAIVLSTHALGIL